MCVWEGNFPPCLWGCLNQRITGGKGGHLCSPVPYLPPSFPSLSCSQQGGFQGFSAISGWSWPTVPAPSFPVYLLQIVAWVAHLLSIVLFHLCAFISWFAQRSDDIPNKVFTVVDHIKPFCELENKLVSTIKDLFREELVHEDHCVTALLQIPRTPLSSGYPPQDKLQNKRPAPYFTNHHPLLHPSRLQSYLTFQVSSWGSGQFRALYHQYQISSFPLFSTDV